MYIHSCAKDPISAPISGSYMITDQRRGATESAHIESSIQWMHTIESCSCSPWTTGKTHIGKRLRIRENSQHGKRLRSDLLRMHDYAGIQGQNFLR